MSQELSQHKACEEPKLFIQVLGKEHPEGHRFFFYDEHDEQEQPGLTDAVEEEDLPEPISRIHSWEWEAEPDRNVWLEIASEEGDPIRVPLFAGVGQTPWQEHERDTVFQQYVVQPIVPLALWQSLVDDASHALPSRPGYLYIHYQGSIWREIEVGVSESDEWQFRDVDLAKHRDESARFIDDQRSSTGQPLTEIWLPARCASSWLSSEIKVAFSDVQWSAARLNCLESDPTAINQRFQPVSLRNPSGRIASGQLLAAEGLVPQRGRSSSLETQLVHPPLWTEDISGSSVAERYQQALSEQQRFDSGGSEAVNGAWNEANRDNSPLRRDVGLRSAAVEVVCQPNRDATQLQEDDEPPVWDDLPEGNDILADARERQIPGLVINDSLFELRHALSQAQLAQNYLTLLLERCASRPHYRSAVLLQKRVMPERIGGENNPLRRFASEPALNYLGGEFHTSVATLSRDIAHRFWEFHQTRLADLLASADYQRVLADYFSLEGSDYVSGFCFAEQCFTALSLDPKRVDTLVDEDIPSLFHTANAGKAQRTLLTLLEEDSREPLHAMCFPDSHAHPAEYPFILPEDEVNDGSGRFRAKALAEEGERSEVPGKDDLQTFEASLLAAMARTSAPSELKRWADALDTVFAKIAESGQNLLAQVADESQRTAVAGKLYMPAFNASRGALHRLLGDLTFQPMGDVDLGRYILIGVEDVKTGMRFGVDAAEREYIARNNHRQFYGEIYRTSSGELLGGTSKQRIDAMGEVGEARDVRFVFAPADSRAVELVRRGRSRIGFVERATNVTRLPYMMVVIQSVNLGQSASVFKDELRLKEVVGFFAASVDLSLAILNISDYLTRRNRTFRAIESTSNFSQKVLLRNGQANIISRFFPSIIRVNWVVSKGAALLVAVSMAWEAIERMRKGDTDASMAFGVAAAGATMLMLFSGPVGWVGLALLLGGGIVGVLLTDGPLEQWIKHGPFGNQRGTAPWLEEAEEAYYRLQSLLANIQVSLRRVPPVELDALLARLGQTHTSPNETAMPIGRLWQEHFDTRQSINTAIEVRSALPGMGIELNDVAVLRLVRGAHYRSPGGSSWDEVSSKQIHPALTQLGSQHITYYVHSPANEPMRGFGSVTEYRWDIQVQLREVTQVPLRPSRRIYPAPAPLTAMPEDMSTILSVEEAADDYWIKERLNVR
ncbi:hypothetical protein QEN58_13670 [Halomonas alkaliantarctica]|uniref:Uncharacterized protein n=1 Tax=Halomonas alkaliantarctica TaxID=232346 RepID=A0ABY8LIU8_9GAMM|nr:hypothetical protein [Halomonas alkaliantarctica]WGI24372.1 hypothetical protein QEN58_13670 [Halomonas alkaliantarctica]